MTSASNPAPSARPVPRTVSAPQATRPLPPQATRPATPAQATAPAARPTTPAGTWAAPQAAGNPWRLGHYVVKERRLTLGRQFRILDAQGRMLAYCKQKMFKLREDIRFYSDESQQREVFRLATQKILDFNANFAVIDSASGQTIAYLRRKGWKSLIKDEWLVFDPMGRQVGNLHEDSTALALVRRFVTRLVPAGYKLLAGPPGAQTEAGAIDERFQVFGDTYDVRAAPGIDGRVMVALAVLVDAVEGE